MNPTEPTSPDAAVAWWYYADFRHQTAGPVTVDQLRQLLVDGSITDSTQVCEPGRDNWRKLSDALPEISKASPPPLPSSRTALPDAPQKVATIKEFRRTCRSCGKVWHSLVEREARIQFDLKANPANQCGGFLRGCGSSASTMQARRNLAADESAISRLQSCPECQSVNYDEEIVEHSR